MSCGTSARGAPAEYPRMRWLLWLPIFATSACATLFPGRYAAKPAGPAPVAKWKPNPDGTFVIGSKYDTRPDKLYVTSQIRVDESKQGPALPIDLVVRENGKEVSHQAFVVDGTGDGNDHAIVTPLPRHAGRIEFQVVEAGQVRESRAFDVGAVPCYGGKRHWEIHSAELELAISGADVSLDVRRWEPKDSDPGYLVEWRREGKIVKTDRARADKLGALFAFYDFFNSWPLYNFDSGECLWDHDSEHYAAPKGLLEQPGAWEVSVYREGQPPLGARFAVADKEIVGRRGGSSGVSSFVPPEPPGVKQRLAAIPREKPYHSDEPLIAPTPALLRALSRDEALARDLAQLNDESGVNHGGSSVLVTPPQGMTRSEREAYVKARTQAVDREVDADRRRARAKAAKKVPALKARLEQRGGAWLSEENPAAAKAEN